jgi:KDO2-lipid IV(A) lauroyltransferase
MIAWLAYVVADLLARTLPVAWADALAVGLARVVFRLRPPARRALEENLARLTGGDDAARERVARRGFESFALGLVDFLRLSRTRRGVLLGETRLSGVEHLEAARASGRGVIVLSAHLGAWERGAAVLAVRHSGLRIAARDHASGHVERFFARRRARFGVGRLSGTPLWRGAADALRRGEWVALMGDRNAPGARGSVCAWAAALARRTGAVVLPAVVVRDASGAWTLCLDAPLGPEACAAGGLRDALRRWIEVYPDQWCAFEPLAEGIA